MYLTIVLDQEKTRIFGSSSSFVLLLSLFFVAFVAFAFSRARAELCVFPQFRTTSQFARFFFVKCPKSLNVYVCFFDFGTFLSSNG